MTQRSFMIGSPLDAGAVSAHFQALANELIRRGHRVVIVAPPKDWSPSPEYARFLVARWPSKRPLGLADATFLWRQIGRYQPDCLIANFGAVNWMCLIGLIRRVPIRIAWYHTLTGQLGEDFPMSAQRSRLLRHRKKWVYSCATHVAVSSRAGLQDIGREFAVPPMKCCIWPNTLADPITEVGLHSSSERDDLIVCAARFNHSKGHKYLVEALGRCKGTLGNTRVEFFGNGPTMDSVRDLAEHHGIMDRCVFRGYVSHAEVLRQMSRALLTVVPSTNEAFGLVNIESMAVATPVLASAVDGILDIVRDGIDGFLVPPGNPAALAEKLMKLLRESDLRAQMGASARSRFLEFYEQSKSVFSQADWLENIDFRSSSAGQSGLTKGLPALGAL